tara:strand:- start:116 stop:718 length:603 start_codon:yes stop_codon:yes gene_type:complete
LIGLIWSNIVGCSSISYNDVSVIQIPDLEVSADNAQLTKDKNGLLLIDKQPFSGHLNTFFSDGKLESRISYFNGLQEGTQTKYYEDGKLREKRTYQLGEKHGEHFGWYPNQQLKFHYIFENGLSIGNHKDWYQNGSLYKDYNYKEGHPFGSQKMWRTDGKLRANYVIREDGRKYGLTGLKRCAKVDSEKESIDPYLAKSE